MDLRYSYEILRQEIDKADFGYVDSNSQLAKDIKSRMNGYIDAIEEMEEQKKMIDVKIKEYRMKLKRTAEEWEI